MARFHSCNVLSAGTDRQLWQFHAQGAFPLAREQKAAEGGGLSPGLTGKSWSQLWQPRLNLALLPPDNVFFRVVHLPSSSPAELHAMVELQLEKLSPLPVGQIVWSLYPLPAGKDAPAAGDLQTLIVVFVERKIVEDYLGALEASGYLADRLELGALDQLAATVVDGQGAWIYPELAGGPNTALVAWWYDGRLQSLNSLNLPPADDPAGPLKEQLEQMAWSGELEGWLTAQPQWTLVASEAVAPVWERWLRDSLGVPVRWIPALTPVALAARTARRAAAGGGQGNLMPPEFATRYRNQFFDRLWIRGMFAAGILYFVLVAIYLLAVRVQDYRLGRAEQKVASLGGAYTNVLQLKERLQVLKTREDLKFAALDCWKITAELLPEMLTLDSFAFADGRKFSLSGSAPADAAAAVNKFYGDIRKATLGGAQLFDANKGQQLSTRAGPGGVVIWNFSLELNRAEED